jgi:hypothetical protein
MELPMTLAQDQEVAAAPEGQVTFEMANLRPQTTKLPFVVWVSQRDGYQHDIRVKVGYNARIFPSQMGSYAVRPFGFVGGQRLHSADERDLQKWVEKNIDALIGFWNADIEFTEDLLAALRPL